MRRALCLSSTQTFAVQHHLACPARISPLTAPSVRDSAEEALQRRLISLDPCTWFLLSSGARNACVQPIRSLVAVQPAQKPTVEDWPCSRLLPGGPIIRLVSQSWDISEDPGIIRGPPSSGLPFLKRSFS